MKRIVSMINNDQFEQLQKYCKKKKISIWKLVKDSVLKEINGKTLDDFAQ